jgi:Protein of unknown function (DUF1348)
MNPRPPLPPFTEETARQKVQAGQDAWNSRDPERVSLAYTEDTECREECETLMEILEAHSSMTLPSSHSSRTSAATLCAPPAGGKTFQQISARSNSPSSAINTRWPASRFARETQSILSVVLNLLKVDLTDTRSLSKKRHCAVFDLTYRDSLLSPA